MVPIHFTTGTSTPVWTQAGNFGSFYGAVGTNAETFFLKIYWQSATNTAPVAGTTVPNITIEFPASPTSVPQLVFERPLVQTGPMFYLVTKNAGDTDATALSTGGDVITLLVE